VLAAIYRFAFRKLRQLCAGGMVSCDPVLTVCVHVYFSLAEVEPKLAQCVETEQDPRGGDANVEHEVCPLLLIRSCAKHFVHTL
jgi:hypothetical protein